MGCKMNCLFSLVLGVTVATGSVEGVFTSALLQAGWEKRLSDPGLGRMKLNFFGPCLFVEVSLKLEASKNSVSLK